MEDFKKCTCCNSKFPKTTDYFHSKKVKQQNKGGLTVYFSLRSVCKKCHSKKTNKRRVEKRCKIMGCDISEYRENWKKQYSKTRTVDLDAKNNLTPSQYTHFKRLLRSNVVANHLEYLTHIEINKGIRNNRIVVSVLAKQKYFTKDDKRKAKNTYNKNNRERLTDAYVANVLIGCKVEDLPVEIIETKRNIIKLKRELKNGK